MSGRRYRYSFTLSLLSPRFPRPWWRQVEGDIYAIFDLGLAFVERWPR